MRNCYNCDCQLKQGAVFCSECGHKVMTNDIQKTPMHNQGIKRSSQSYILIIIIGIFILGLGLIGGGYVLGAKFFSPERVVNNFIKGLSEQNKEMVQNHLVSSDSRLVINEETITPLLLLLEQSPSTLEVISNDLKNQINEKHFDKQEFTNFYIKKSGKNFFVFDRYVIEPSLHFLEIELFGEKGVVYINGKKLNNMLNNNEKIELGPYITGIYKVHARQDGEYVQLEDVVDVQLLNDLKSSVTLDIQGQYVHIDSNDHTAELVVNGRETGLTIGESKNFGPVPLDGSISVSALKNEQGNTYESVVMPVDSNYVFLEISKGSATATSQTNVVTQPVYIYRDSSGFIFPDSHVRKLSNSEVAYLTKYELYLARNEIFARHGYVFKNEDLRQHFHSLPWYYPNPYYSHSLSAIEEYNVHLIKSYE